MGNKETINGNPERKQSLQYGHVKIMQGDWLSKMTPLERKQNLKIKIQSGNNELAWL